MQVSTLFGKQGTRPPNPTSLAALPPSTSTYADVLHAETCLPVTPHLSFEPSCNLQEGPFPRFPSSWISATSDMPTLDESQALAQARPSSSCQSMASGYKYAPLTQPPSVVLCMHWRGQRIQARREMRSKRANENEKTRTCWREWPEADPE